MTLLKGRKIATPPSELPRLRDIHIFALIFTAIFLLHAPLLRLPYFWDEAGYYIPSAYEFFTHGSIVPRSIPSNAHPPLLAIYLALWWKLSAFKPAVTRTAMLLLAALALTAVFKLSRRLANARVAAVVTVCAALYPVWFAQSSLAHADLPAAAFSLWGLYFYFRSMPGAGGGSLGPIRESTALEQTAANRDAMLAAAFFWLSAVSKETSIIIPVSLAIYDLADSGRRRSGENVRYGRRSLLLLS